MRSASLTTPGIPSVVLPVTGLLTLWLALLSPSNVLAHKPSDAYLILDLDREHPMLRLDIALRDLEHAIGLDANGDGNVTWGELRARHLDIADYALARLDVISAEGPCDLLPGVQQVEDRSDGAYTVLPVAIGCPGGAPIRLGYRLLFDLDPTHRGLASVRRGGGVSAGVLSADRPMLELGSAEPGTSRSAWHALVDYGWEGVWHIWIGLDHVLFLLALLLPSVLRREHGRWCPLPAPGPALKDVMAVVTAFAVAHSITLSLAVLGWVSLPARWVESAIAATIVVAALNNLRPLVPGNRWAIAFVLGLIHGLGFAAVLVGLGLPNAALLPALAGFNLGVEAGQLVIVALFLPTAYLLRNTELYRRGALGLGSAAVTGIALVWFVERSLDLTLMNL